MSLHFLIDGYNVIKKADFFRDSASLRNARRVLIGALENRPKTSKNNQTTIVFDGRNGVGPYLEKSKSQIKIVFSKDRSADEVIKKMVSECPNPKQIVVISDDKELIFSVRSLGAGIMSVNKFLNQIGAWVKLTDSQKRKIGLHKIGTG